MQYPPSPLGVPLEPLTPPRGASPAPPPGIIRAPHHSTAHPTPPYPQPHRAPLCSPCPPPSCPERGTWQAGLPQARPLPAPSPGCQVCGHQRQLWLNLRVTLPGSPPFLSPRSPRDCASRPAPPPSPPALGPSRLLSLSFLLSTGGLPSSSPTRPSPQPLTTAHLLPLRAPCSAPPLPAQV